MILFIDPHHLEVPNGHLRVPVLPGHPGPLEDTRWVGTHSNRTGMPVHLLYTVTRALARKVVPFHDAGRPATLRGPNHINVSGVGKNANRNRLTHLATMFLAVGAKLSDKSTRLTARLWRLFDPGLLKTLLTLTINTRNMTSFAPPCETARLVLKAQLHGRVSVALAGS
jgi:hypothetical protein